MGGVAMQGVGARVDLLEPGGAERSFELDLPLELGVAVLIHQGRRVLEPLLQLEVYVFDAGIQATGLGLQGFPLTDQA